MPVDRLPVKLICVVVVIVFFSYSLETCVKSVATELVYRSVAQAWLNGVLENRFFFLMKMFSILPSLLTTMA